GFWLATLGRRCSTPRVSSTALCPRATRPLSLHDALPICHETLWARGSAERRQRQQALADGLVFFDGRLHRADRDQAAVEEDEAIDRKSTRLNSSHRTTSYAVSCLKKNTTQPTSPMPTAPH